jgi:hypothetical protein
MVSCPLNSYVPPLSAHIERTALDLVPLPEIRLLQLMPKRAESRTRSILLTANPGNSTLQQLNEVSISKLPL